jgi:hypothetical protein
VVKGSPADEKRIENIVDKGLKWVEDYRIESEQVVTQEFQKVQKEIAQIIGEEAAEAESETEELEAKSL